MIELLKTFKTWLLLAIVGPEQDPVRHCPVYRNIGCCHVDGYLCELNTCSIKRKYVEGLLKFD